MLLLLLGNNVRDSVCFKLGFKAYIRHALVSAGTDISTTLLLSAETAFDSSAGVTAAAAAAAAAAGAFLLGNHCRYRVGFAVCLEICKRHALICGSIVRNRNIAAAAAAAVL